jgi:hypothetical protein
VASSAVSPHREQHQSCWHCSGVISLKRSTPLILLVVIVVVAVVVLAAAGLVALTLGEEHVRRPDAKHRKRRGWLLLAWDPQLHQLDRYLAHCRTCGEAIRDCNHYMGVGSNWHRIRDQAHSHPDGTPHFPDLLAVLRSCLRQLILVAPALS